MDTQIETTLNDLDMRYAGLSLAELKAQALEREHAHEQVENARALANQIAAGENWNALLAVAKADLHPELYARINVDRPENFAGKSDEWPLWIEVPQHSPLRVIYFRTTERGWYRSIDRYTEQPYYEVACYMSGYGERNNYVKSDWNTENDLGKALLRAEREYVNGLQLKAQAEQANAERAASLQVRAAREDEEKPKTPEESLMAALKEWMRSEITNYV